MLNLLEYWILFKIKEGPTRGLIIQHLFYEIPEEITCNSYQDFANKIIILKNKEIIEEIKEDKEGRYKSGIKYKITEKGELELKNLRKEDYDLYIKIISFFPNLILERRISSLEKFIYYGALSIIIGYILVKNTSYFKELYFYLPLIILGIFGFFLSIAGSHFIDISYFPQKEYTEILKKQIKKRLFAWILTSLFLAYFVIYRLKYRWSWLEAIPAIILLLISLLLAGRVYNKDKLDPYILKIKKIFD